MPVMQSRAMQTFFANQAAPLFRGTLNDPASAIRVVESCLRSTLQAAGIPQPLIAWKDPQSMGSHKALTYVDRWKLDINTHIIQALHVKISLIRALSIVYHELRHFEQVYIMIVALLANRIPFYLDRSKEHIPTPGRYSRSRGRNCYQKDAYIDEKASLLMEDFPEHVVDMAYQQAVAEYPSIRVQQKEHWLANNINQSMLGGSAAEDYQVFQRQGQPKHERSTNTVHQRHAIEVKRYSAYVSQFREADAFMLEQAMMDILREMYEPTLQIPPCVKPQYLDDPSEAYLEDIGPLLFGEPRE